MDHSEQGAVRALFLASCILLSACGGGSGGGGSGGGSSGGKPPNPGGIFNGNLTQNGNSVPLMAFIDENGTAMALELLPDQVVIVPAVAPNTITPDSNGNFTLNYDAYDNQGSGLCMSSLDPGTIKAVLTARTSIVGSVTSGCANGSAVSLAYDAPNYERPASLGTIAGTYVLAYYGGRQRYTVGTLYQATITIGAAGAISGSDGSCSYGGTVSVVDPAYNMYDVTLADSCTSDGPASGVAAYFPGTSTTKASIKFLGKGPDYGFYGVFTAN
jgi:hypothetical protein